ncbi:MAG: ABC transporter permease [Candidatus Nanohaloarchaea archaeon]
MKTKQNEINRSKNTFYGDVVANFKRWITKFLRSPHEVIMNLLNPIIFLIMFTEIFGHVVSGPISQILGSQVNYTTFLLPAIAMQVAVTTGQGAGIGLVRDIDEWIFEKVMVSPMNKIAVFLGKTFSEISRIAVQILIVLILGILLGANISTGVLGIIGVILVGMIFSMVFISLTTTIAMITKDQEAMMAIMMPIMFPLLFLSSAFLPLKMVPSWIQTIAKVNPVTYGVDAARAIILEKNVSTVLDVSMFSGMWNTIIPSIAILLVYILVLGAIAVYTIKRETSSEAK